MTLRPSSLVVVLLLSACHRTQHYEAKVEIARLSAHRAEDGHVVATDVEVSYVGCPGDQLEVIRGGTEFSQCIGKLKVGDRIAVKVVHQWDPQGYYDHKVYEVQGCKRPPDPKDDASYKMVRECSDWVEHGSRVGFQCNYTDKDELVKQCPWFKRR